MIKSRPNRILAAAEAARIWSLYGFASPTDLILENLAMAHGVLVIDGRLDSAIGRLVRTGDAGIIRISHSIREPGRRRFAIAHEIGHWFLHNKVSHLLACTDADMLATYNSSHLEIEASIFAGSLLMPENLFVARVSHRRPTTIVLNDLCNYFSTTLTATALRYVETSDDYYVFVISENNRIKWWRASKAFGERDLWIENKSILPQYSAAVSFFRGETVPDSPQRVDFCDWFGHIPDIDGDTVIEQAIPLPSYNQVLSMLWLP